MPPPAGTEGSRVSRRRQVASSEVRRAGLATACAMSTIVRLEYKSVTESLMEVSDQDISGKWQDA
jgi:hypothetical protein